MAEYLSPGVYVEDPDDLPGGMVGVGTSTAGFVGLAEKGKAGGEPVLVTNYSDFKRQYGGYLSEEVFGEYRYLAGAVEQFFQNGGTRCYVARVLPADAKTAVFENQVLTVRASSEGRWGNQVRLDFSEVARKKMQLLEQKSDKVYLAKSVSGFCEGSLVKAEEEYNRITSICGNEVTFENAFSQNVTDENLLPEKYILLSELEIQVRCKDETEEYTELSLYEAAGNCMNRRIEKSGLVSVNYHGGTEELRNPVEALQLGKDVASVLLEGGEDGTKEQVSAGTFTGMDGGPGARTGIQTFLDNHMVSMMAVPGITIPGVITSLVAHCEKTLSRVAVLDMPRDMVDKRKLIEYRDQVDSTYAAMYHPWIQIFDHSNKKNAFFPPSGAVMGIYSRTDNTRGVHKAPANETVACTGLSINFTTGDQDVLNPAGINLIRSFPGQGIRVWGARTASSNAAFKYINVRRLFIYVEESIKANIKWAAFEPNDETLWYRVQISTEFFLNTAFRCGMFAGGAPAEGYFVQIGRTTMTQDDISNGRLIMNVGIAPARPAEFIIFRIIQHTAGTES